MLHDITVRRVDQQVDLVADREAQLIRQRLTDQDSLAVVRGEEFALDQTLTIDLVRLRLGVEADDLDAARILAARHDSTRDEARGRVHDLRILSLDRVGQRLRVFDQVFPFQADLVFIVIQTANLEMSAEQLDGVLKRALHFADQHA